MTTQTVKVQELMAERPEMVESIIDLIIADSIAFLVKTDYTHLSDLFFESGADIVEKYKDSIKCMRLYSDYLVLHSLVQKVICNIGTELFCDMWDADEEENKDFDQWLATNYSPAGEDASNGEQWFLSNSPNEFMPVSLSTLKEQWEKDNLPEDDKVYHLVVVDNVSGETIYHRELTHDGDLLMVPRSFIPEIQGATGILIDKKSGNYPGCGQVGITIGFSSTPQNDTCVWDTEDYNLAN